MLSWRNYHKYISLKNIFFIQKYKRRSLQLLAIKIKRITKNEKSETTKSVDEEKIKKLTTTYLSVDNIPKDIFLSNDKLDYFLESGIVTVEPLKFDRKYDSNIAKKKRNIF